MADYLRKPIFGIGINDADYNVYKTVNGKQLCCNFYMVWKSMLARCYSQRFQSANKTYVGCETCKEWLTFSSFKRWMETQDWEGKHLDKDMLKTGNKIYCPELCVFVSQCVNSFVTDSAATRGELPIGVTYSKKYKKYQASCRNPISKRKHSEFIGYFDTALEAHSAWRNRKISFANQLADMQADSRVAKSLRERYL